MRGTLMERTDELEGTNEEAARQEHKNKNGMATPSGRNKNNSRRSPAQSSSRSGMELGARRSDGPISNKTFPESP